MMSPPQNYGPRSTEREYFHKRMDGQTLFGETAITVTYTYKGVTKTLPAVTVTTRNGEVRCACHQLEIMRAIS